MRSSVKVHTYGAAGAPLTTVVSNQSRLDSFRVFKSMVPLLELSTISAHFSFQPSFSECPVARHRTS
jgi:hypothetical protein